MYIWSKIHLSPEMPQAAQMDFRQVWMWRNNRFPQQPPPVKRTGLENGCKHISEGMPSWDIVRYALFDRPIGCATRRPDRLVEPYLARQLPGLLKERSYDLEKINKIFAAQWLNDHQVILGSKCNKLVILDLETNKMVRIPMLHSRLDRAPPECPCGIHSIAINPSRTLLATGGDNVNDVAIYRLPTFDPVCIGENGHSDWIFDLQWLDDQIVVSGSRDNNVALWRVQDTGSESDWTMPSFTLSSMQNSNLGLGQAEESSLIVGKKEMPLSVPTYSHLEPLCIKPCDKAEKVRAFAYNDHRQELAVLSLNAYLHLWDATTFTQRRSKKLRHLRENVCLAVSKCERLYAVGSQSYITLLDERVSREVAYIPSKQRGCGVRSLNFVDTLLTIGTGMGGIYFYDRRAENYVELNCGHPCSLTVGDGWLRHDETYQEFFADHTNANAVYAHQFDESGTRLFAAGGPLPAGLWGNYAALWQ